MTHRAPDAPGRETRPRGDVIASAQARPAVPTHEIPSRWSALYPLRLAGFRYLFVAGSLWYFGRWMETVVLGWLVLQITNSPFHVAMVAFFRSAPAFFLALLSGPIADRLSRRRLLIATQVLNFTVSLGVLLVVWLGLVEFWHIAIASTLMGVSWALDWPNRRAFVMDVVGPDRIHGSIVLDTMASNISRIAGPLTGGGVIALIGVTGSYWLLAGAYLTSVLSLWRVPRVKEARGEREPIGRGLATGFAYARRSEAIVGVLIVTVVMNVGIFQHNQIFAVFARDVLHVGPFLLGLLAAADGIGSMIGALILGFGLRDRRRGLVFLGGSLVKAALIGLFALSPWYPVAFILLLLAGVAHTGFSAYQTLIPLVLATPEMRGRMMALIALAIGTTPIGAFTLGTLASATSAPVAVSAMAAASVACLVLVWFRLPELGRV
ncbi:MAG TPA: MFS transporter [Dehalococcoidia bacterium]|nr:MFS transporter [Dehalococcoidia bacterium]